MTRVVYVCTIVVSLAALSGCSATKQAYVAKGNKLFAARKYEEAALNYRTAILKDGGYGEAYYGLGVTAIKLDQAPEAYNALLRAVQLLPGSVEAKKKFSEV